jgi:hypothetical protein
MSYPGAVKERAQKYKLGTKHLDILNAIAHWFNGYTFETYLGELQLGCTHEQDIEVHTSAITEWTDDHRLAFQGLKDANVFKPEEDAYIAGRRCDWLPSSDGINLIEDVFEPATTVYPPWQDEHHTSPPLFRDGAELLRHRKGVETAAQTLGELPKAGNFHRYPAGGDEKDRADLHIYNRDNQPFLRVEVLTDSNNRGSWQSKWERWTEKTRPRNVWIFQNRQAMVKFFNHMHRHTDLFLDRGEFGGNPSNWSPKRVNDRLDRTRDRTNYSSMDFAWTTSGLLDMHHLDFDSRLREYGFI